MRYALGLSYRGSAYNGWQSQPDGNTVQDRLEMALTQFADEPIRTLCAGRTDAGVHAMNQVVHFDSSRERELFSWVRGTNRFLPRDIAVQWCLGVTQQFHARSNAQGRRYAYVLLESAVRPAVEADAVGWAFRPLNGGAMREGAQLLIGEHDFSAFRSAECQAASPVKMVREISIERRGAYWRFEFDANAFLHHMVRNIVGSLVAVGAGRHEPAWITQVLASRSRELAAPTFSPSGLYFIGPYYDAQHGIPRHTAAMDWLP
jgi:tRNA pseudouridine38-40 synthase